MHNFFRLTSLVLCFFTFFPTASFGFRIVGSTAVYGFVTQVAERMGQTTKYKAPIVEATGSGGGLKLFCGGQGDSYPLMVNSSRRISELERRYCSANGVDDIIELKIGYDGIVIGISTESDVFDLTRLQLSKALSEKAWYANPDEDNKAQMWSDIDPDLPNHPIKVLGPTATLATREVFEELVIQEGCLSAGNSLKTCTTNIREDDAFIEVAEQENVIIQKLSLSKDAIGFVSFGYYKQNPEKVKAIPIDGVLPTYQSIADGTYPLSRPLYIYIKGSAVKDEAARKFLDELFSTQASGPDGYLAEKGLIALPKDERAKMVGKFKQEKAAE